MIRCSVSMLVLLGLSLSAPLALAGGKVKRAEALAHMILARDAWDVRAEDRPAFQYSGPVSITLPGRKPLLGHHSVAWSDASHHRRELSLPGFHELTVANDEGVWFLREPSQYLQLVADIQHALSPLDLLTPEVYEAVSAGKRVQRGGRELVFVRMVSRKDSPPPIWKLYLDPSTSTLALAESLVSFTSYRYHGSLAIGERSLPKHIEILHSEDVVASIEVETLQVGAPLSPGLFLRPANARGGVKETNVRCEDFRMPKPLHSPKPVVPGDIRLGGGRGEIRLRYTVSREGKVEDLGALWASHASFVEPALLALKDWRFRPGYCGDEAVRVVRTVIIYAR